jgi:hypothetical protein
MARPAGALTAEGGFVFASAVKIGNPAFRAKLLDVDDLAAHLLAVWEGDGEVVVGRGWSSMSGGPIAMGYAPLCVQV